jgi:hypothetical protein
MLRCGHKRSSSSQNIQEALTEMVSVGGCAVHESRRGSAISVNTFISAIPTDISVNTFISAIPTDISVNMFISAIPTDISVNTFISAIPTDTERVRVREETQI